MGELHGVPEWGPLLQEEDLTMEELKGAFALGKLRSLSSERRVVVTEHLVHCRKSDLTPTAPRPQPVPSPCLQVIGHIIPSTSNEEASSCLQRVLVISEHPPDVNLLPIHRLLDPLTPQTGQLVMKGVHSLARRLRELHTHNLSMWGHNISLEAILVSESWELFLLPFSSQVQWKVDETSILYLTFPWAEMVSQRNFDLACQKTLSDAQCQDIRAFQVLLSQLLLICDGKPGLLERQGVPALTRLKEDAEETIPLLDLTNLENQEIATYAWSCSFLPWSPASSVSLSADAFWVHVLTGLTSGQASRVFRCDTSTIDFWNVRFPMSISTSIEELVDRIFQHCDQLTTRESKSHLAMTALFADIIGQFDRRTGTVKDDSTVSIREFRTILSYFGPVGPDLIRTCTDYARAKWFHGMVSKRELKDFSRLQKDGSFLLRFSASQPGSFAFTRKANGKVENFIIQHSFGKEHVFDHREYESLSELVFKKKRKWDLSSCDGSPFQIIFSPKSPQCFSRYTEFN